MAAPAGMVMHAPRHDVVQQGFDMGYPDFLYLHCADGGEISLFGEILADESVGVLIQPFLPRMVRAAKISLRSQCLGYFGVLVEFFAVVHGDGVHPAFMCL